MKGDGNGGQKAHWVDKDNEMGRTYRNSNYRRWREKRESGIKYKRLENKTQFIKILAVSENKRNHDYVRNQKIILTKPFLKNLRITPFIYILL